MTRENQLGDFLRARRDLVSPQEVGLPWHMSRRVKGLRRDEVALLAGVSTDYYTRLEQGRERHPSEQVLGAVARALRLDDSAAAHLFQLVQPAPRTAAAPVTTVSPELSCLMEHFLDLPACIVGPALDILAANRSGRQLFSGFARMDNQLRMLFLDPAGRRFYRDWERAARGMVSNLRAQAAPFPDDPRIAQVIGELSLRSPAFAQLWARYDVRPCTSDDKPLWHPQVGEMYLHYESFTVASAPGQRLLVYSAEPGTPSADALVLLRTLAEEPRSGHPARTAS
ncbi:XRE family transcriptional regulator [Streptomyces yokosukanensis]|uniref:XRE family transcriptional regulator n=1 Tax=Streptomyces yokosukanensis TaxID=67386 RepID=A0A101P128_9ACTN|nr:helix-turn-helix transcriptional regulator [Streptomyces yokosukanensis]KUN02972.1 XRE family transcriptional regulator [Streptomyces yokosukanensis]